MIKRCIWCDKEFETNKGNHKRCPACREQGYNTRPKKKEKGKPALSINEVMHIASVYDAVNGTKIIRDYGKITNIIKAAEDNICVCCGSEISAQGRMVCLNCENKYNNQRYGGKV